jgi:hypothetical protein
MVLPVNCKPIIVEAKIISQDKKPFEAKAAELR